MKYVSNTTRRPIRYKDKVIPAGAQITLNNKGEIVEDTEDFSNATMDYVDHRFAAFSKDLDHFCRSLEKMEKSVLDVRINVSNVYPDIKRDLTNSLLCTSCDNACTNYSFSCTTPLPMGLYSLVGPTKAKTGAGITAETPKVEMTIPYTIDGKYCVYLSYCVTYCIPITDTYKVCIGTGNSNAKPVYAITADKNIQAKTIWSCYKYVDNKGADVCSSNIDKNALLPKELFDQLLNEKLLESLSLSVSNVFKRL